jgi:RNA polymerase sigma factor (TIGR02999 family)
LRAFLLGTLPDAERVNIEEQFLGDEDFLAAVEAAEHELLDDYARGYLSADESARVAAVYRSTPIRAQRIRIARAIRAWGSANDSAVTSPDRSLTGKEYEQLRRMATRVLKRTQLDLPISPADLAIEAYQRLLGLQLPQGQDRIWYLAVAARVMRKTLVDLARADGGLSRSREHIGTIISLNLDESTNLRALDRALDHLAQINPRQGSVIDLLYFAQLTVEQIARILHISAREVKRTISLFRALLHKFVTEEHR